MLGLLFLTLSFFIFDVHVIPTLPCSVFTLNLSYITCAFVMLECIDAVSLIKGSYLSQL